MDSEGILSFCRATLEQVRDLADNTDTGRIFLDTYARFAILLSVFDIFYSSEKLQPTLQSSAQ
jgi:hypothetical protein